MTKHSFIHIAEHFFLPLSVAAIITSLSSCTDDTIDYPDGGKKISFEVNLKDSWTRSGNNMNQCDQLPSIALHGSGETLYLIPETSVGIETDAATGTETRAEAMTNETIADFGVYAKQEDGTSAYYMENVEVTKDNSWTPREEYLWPGKGKLHFNAYSPYCESPQSDSGITSLPENDEAETPVIGYTVPKEVEAQTDLMWATPCDASASPCELTFNHGLAAVKFVAGGEMVPCKVKSITISGLSSSGNLNLENGMWTDVSGNESYSVNVNTTLLGTTGQEYVEEGTPITGSNQTFMLIPQSLTEESTVTMVIEYEGAEVEFSASLDGQNWVAGNTYTYHLSANPSVDRFVITVTSPLSFNYTGGTGQYTVKSIHEKIQNGVLSTTEVPWKAQFVDEEGNEVSRPSWISELTTSGTGNGDFTVKTDVVEPTFLKTSDATRRMQQQPKVGTATAPYNLANSSGASTVLNTANCYVINAPGIYSIPLVYGNAIKNGVDNTSAYVPTRTSAPFVNYSGKRITQPYIYDNEGNFVISEATLIWEEQLEVVHNLHLSADGKSLVFEIPENCIRQGNALIGVTDSEGNIIWSWHLWLTDYTPGDNMSTLSYNGTSFEMMPYNVGHVTGGDEIDFASSTVRVRFTQQTNETEAGSSTTMVIDQAEKQTETLDGYNYYQWGRKDPTVSGVREWFVKDHTSKSKLETESLPVSGNKATEDYEALCVANPQVFWIVNSSEPTFKFTNNWNLGSSTHRVKTIYDPCPVGFMVPGNEIMALRDIEDNLCSFNNGGGIGSPAYFQVTCEQGSPLILPALGYRSSSTGNLTITDSTDGRLAALWTSHSNTREGSAQIFDYVGSTLSHPLRSDPRMEGFAVRPIRE